MIDFTVRPDEGEPYEMKATARDVLIWEKTTKGKTMQQLYVNVSMIDMYKVAHIAARRLGLFHGSLPEFEASCELEFETEEEPDPTLPTP